MRVLKRESSYCNESSSNESQKFLNQLDGMLFFDDDENEVEVSFKKERNNLGTYPTRFILFCSDNNTYYVFAPKMYNRYAVFSLNQKPKASCATADDWKLWQENNRGNLIAAGDLDKVVRVIRKYVAESLGLDY